MLAAGDSTRMGSPKALLQTPDGRTFAASIVRSFAAAGVSEIVIVTGRDHEQVVAAVRSDQPPVEARFARNPDPSRGQLSSLWVGMDAVVGPATAGLLVTLVDVPLIAPATVRAVLEAWQRTGAPIVRPAIGDRHGHPVLFDRSLFDELRQAPLEGGAKTVVRRHEARIVNIVPPDDGCLRDIDTPEDYASLLT